MAESIEITADLAEGTIIANPMRLTHQFGMAALTSLYKIHAPNPRRIISLKLACTNERHFTSPHFSKKLFSRRL